MLFSSAKQLPEMTNSSYGSLRRLEAAGYTVYADILRLRPRYALASRIDDDASVQSNQDALMLPGLQALSRNGVQEEIGIAEDLVKELKDPQFIIPLRIQPYKKVFGIGELQYVDFSKSWAEGLNHLLDALHKQNVLRDTSSIRISPNWEQYRQRNAVQIKNEPEALTSNWLRVVEIPDTIRYFSPTGAVDHAVLQKAAREFEYHARAHERGFFSFASLDDVNDKLDHVGKFDIRSRDSIAVLCQRWLSRAGDQRPRSLQLGTIRYFGGHGKPMQKNLVYLASPIRATWRFMYPATRLGSASGLVGGHKAKNAHRCFEILQRSMCGPSV